MAQQYLFPGKFRSNKSLIGIGLMMLLLLQFQHLCGQETLFKLLPSKSTGVQFTNLLNEDEGLNVLSYEYFYNGGGLAVGDINNDGLLDLYFSANMKPNKLYLNLGDLKFKDITKSAGAEGRGGGWKTGVTMADVNNDGLLDIYICYSGKYPEKLRANQLLVNQGDLRFKDQAKEYGLDDIGYSTQAAFFDFDNDGDLDLFLLNHNVKKYDNLELAKFRKETDPLAANKLLENTGGSFVDISAKAGIYQNPLTFGLGIAISDINKDGWQDMYVTNDYNEPDYLYINNHDKTFTDHSKSSLRHISHFSMGVDIADFNNDAFPDIITLDMLPEDNRRQKLLQLQENYESFQLMQDQGLHKQFMRNMLQLNNGDGTFSEIAQLSGISNTDWSWCPLFADFDNDGFKDLFVSTGYLRDYTNKDFLRYWGDYKIKKAMDREPMLMMDLVRAMPTTPFRNYIFRNEKNLRFSNQQENWGFTHERISSAAVYADLDNDGDLELIVNNINSEADIYKNFSTETSGNSYLGIQLSGTNNEAGIGAKVSVFTKGNSQYQEVNPNRGYLSGLSTRLNFGLNKSSVVDSVIVLWPDRNVQVLRDVRVNQQLLIKYESGRQNDSVVNTKASTFFEQASSPFKYHQESVSVNDFKRQPLMLFMYSNVGPVMAKADLNGDGLEDVFVSGNPSAIYLQHSDGSFLVNDTTSFGKNADRSISAALFFDANMDGFPDLYLAMGGYSLYEPGSLALQDELYLNDGKGNFRISRGALPNMSASGKSVVRACDVDGDGDLDLFVGGRVVPGQYPASPNSYLLRNNGKGLYVSVATVFDSAGMITDAAWEDLNNDQRPDLILCGEFMPVSVYINTTAGFVNKTHEFLPDAAPGFWFGLNITDIDGDGLKDIVAGNLGINSQIRATPSEPAELFYADFDGNGSIDPFFNFFMQGKSYPFISRDELNDQIYPMRRKFTSYKNYADATMNSIFTEDELKKASRLQVTEMHTMSYLRRGNQFVKKELPVEAQFSVVSKIITGDFNRDGNTDLVLLGNRSDNRLKIGSIDAGYGLLLIGDGKGNFQYINQYNSGLNISGDVKSAEKITIRGERYLIIGSSGQELQTYKWK